MKTELRCTACGKEFERDARKEWGANQGARRNHFCSPECSKTHWNGIGAERRKHPLLPRPCGSCGKEFTPAKRSVAKFCSRKCSDHSKWLLKHPSGPQGTVSCAECSKEFDVPIGRNCTRRKFCSPVCRNRFYAKLWRATHPGWRAEHDRKNKWGGNWFKALERDGVKCQVCGFQASMDDLSLIHVHHVDGEGTAHGKNHSIENLQTLCSSCHAKLHHVHGVRIVRIEGKLFVKFGERMMEVKE